jgi:hypothetical protein
MLKLHDEFERIVTMMTRRIVTAVVAGALSWPAVIFAQPTVQDSSTPAAQTSAAPIPTDQLVTMTVHEAWVASGRNEDKFFDLVKQLTELSAQKRGITLPETPEAGAKAGNWIKKEARKDPDQLLYAVVDRAVRYVGRTQAAAATPAAK